MDAQKKDKNNMKLKEKIAQLRKSIKIVYFEIFLHLHILFFYFNWIIYFRMTCNRMV